MRSKVRDQPHVSTRHRPVGEVVTFVAAYLGSDAWRRHNVAEEVDTS